jgi:hypothetical protein
LLSHRLLRKCLGLSILLCLQLLSRMLRLCLCLRLRLCLCQRLRLCLCRINHAVQSMQIRLLLLLLKPLL